MDFIEIKKGLFVKREDISTVSVEHGCLYMVLKHGFIDDGYLRKSVFIDYDGSEEIKSLLCKLGINYKGSN